MVEKRFMMRSVPLKLGLVSSVALITMLVLPSTMTLAGEALELDARFQKAQALYWSPEGRKIEGVQKVVSSLTELSDAGHIEAAYFLGKIYKLGDLGAPADFELSFQAFQKAARLGHPGAQFELARFYSQGKGCEKDFVKAAEFYLLAAEAGDVNGQFHIAMSYQQGFGVEKNLGEALKWYEAAAKQGDSVAAFQLAELYRAGEGVTVDINAAYRWYKVSSDASYAPAQLALARYFEDRNKKDQKDPLLAAAEQDSRDAYYLMAKRHEVDAVASEEKKEKYLIWLRKAALAGHVDAQYDLALQHEPEVLETDAPEYEKWLRFAAGQGHVQAQFRLAEYLALPQRFKKSELEVYTWFDRAASQGHAQAAYELGSLLLKDGYVNKHDYEQAKYWLHQATQSQYAPAQRKLGLMYLDGIGVMQNEVRGRGLLEDAAKGGDAVAQIKLDVLARYAV